MSGRRYPVAVTVGVALGAVLVTWAAGRGPAPLVTWSDRRVAREFPAPTGTPMTQAGEPDPLRSLRGRDPVHDLSWVGELVGWALLLLLLAAAAVALRRAWRHRPRRSRVPTVEFEVLPDADRAAESLADAAAAQLTALDEGAPAEAIVRCWWRLEDAVADAGVVRAPAETSTELTVRVLRALDLDPRPVGELAALYREARFSGHRLGEPDRAAARSALQRIHAELPGRRAAASRA